MPVSYMLQRVLKVALLNKLSAFLTSTDAADLVALLKPSASLSILKIGHYAAQLA